MANNLPRSIVYRPVMTGWVDVLFYKMESFISANNTSVFFNPEDFSVLFIARILWLGSFSRLIQKHVLSKRCDIIWHQKLSFVILSVGKIDVIWLRFNLQIAF